MLGQCEMFEWGGCEANGNNFLTYSECQGTCPTCQTSGDCPNTYCPNGYKTDEYGCRISCECNCPCEVCLSFNFHCDTFLKFFSAKQSKKKFN